MSGIKVLMPSEEEYVITMVRPLRIYGKVVDAETGKPIEKFQIIPGIGWGRNSAPHWERGNLKGCSAGTYETDGFVSLPGAFNSGRG